MNSSDQRSEQAPSFAGAFAPQSCKAKRLTLQNKALEHSFRDDDPNEVLRGVISDSSQPNGFEPELGGIWRQKGVFVDENICIGCKNCTHVATNTFYIEPEYGRARVFNQDGDVEELIEEAIDTCPVNCIHWLDYTELTQVERARQHQVIQSLAIPPNMRRSQIIKRSERNS